MINIKTATKIVVIGSPGSGKTTIAKILSSKLGLSVLHLDNIYWRDTWIKHSDEEIRDSIYSFLQNKKWIIEGNYEDFFLEERFRNSECILFLDFSPSISIYRVIKRHIKYLIYPYKKSLVSNKINFKFIITIIFKQKHRNKQLHKFINPYINKTVIINKPAMLHSYLSRNGVNYE